MGEMCANVERVGFYLGSGSTSTADRIRSKSGLDRRSGSEQSDVFEQKGEGATTGERSPVTGPKRKLSSGLEGYSDQQDSEDKENRPTKRSRQY